MAVDFFLDVCACFVPLSVPSLGPGLWRVLNECVPEWKTDSHCPYLPAWMLSPFFVKHGRWVCVFTCPHGEQQAGWLLLPGPAESSEGPWSACGVPPARSDPLKSHWLSALRDGNSLVVQWLGLCAFTTWGLDSIPGRGTKILQAGRCGQKKKKKRIETLSCTVSVTYLPNWILFGNGHKWVSQNRYC